ncbi:hypothetical protein [Clavibacter michiganensis]|uniref:Uncharacterized protein n=1 Tax=Clavibacter michiganensis subsp. insidiosus TaxID=33014 RepID=A0A399SR53_9MICO|nr:hypothetical protein [Clavibacter michiganensis]AWF99811.1 hypothetical protein BEH61_14990 [Clavibacter michiganensis subsp. insidiosus]AWG02915.1 hypothetical protein BEH62_15075 [Clavibacter michiganensis subsp. insidiosus]OQJ56851.1 hypothetical protein B5P21_16200 [Clavibacter michiganensis subsp. insidiosus]RII88818.1 hypothetical protein DZF92_01525 [Clavibacter michiganensis subsp. insidiosus]RIJ44437.1 hypothetical protein DZF93_02855 [Clavibacter michiganensis subsp. insidiosus]
MARLTRRDVALFDWFATVRIANMEALRWVLPAAAGRDEPVTVRKAQHWCARMESLELVKREQLFQIGGAVVWPTATWASARQPHLLSQTTRHEVSVSIVAARYLAAGYEWFRDRPAKHKYEHQADGIARHGSTLDAVEVELTAKRQQRYGAIFRAFDVRLQKGEITHVTYFTNVAGGRGIQQALSGSAVPASVRSRLRVVPVFDDRGHWFGDQQPVELGGEWVAPALPAPVDRSYARLPDLFDADPR